MEGPSGAMMVPTIAPNFFYVVFGAPPLINAFGVQPKKQVGRKKLLLAIKDVHFGGRRNDGAIANILGLYKVE